MERDALTPLLTPAPMREFPPLQYTIATGATFRPAERGDPLVTGQNALEIKYQGKSGEEVGEYIIRDIIGKGGMGVAYRARLTGRERSSMPKELIIKQLTLEFEEALVTPEGVDALVAFWQQENPRGKAAELRQYILESVKQTTPLGADLAKLLEDYPSFEKDADLDTLSIKQIRTDLRTLSQHQAMVRYRNHVETRRLLFEREYYFLEFMKAHKIRHVARSFGEFMGVFSPKTGYQLVHEYYFGQQIVPGVSLKEMRATSEPKVHKIFREKEAIDYIYQALNILQPLHTLGMVHNDVVPGNMLIHKGVLRLIDCGGAYAVPGSVAYKEVLEKHKFTDNAHVHTKGYAAPEVIVDPKTKTAGEVTCKSDIFSLGMVLYVLLTGESAEDKDFPNFEERLNSAQVSEGLKDIIRKATTVDVDKRYDATKMLQALAEYSLSGVRTRIAA